MTDFEKLHNLLDIMELPHESGQDGSTYFILLREGEGYPDFWCEFTFNKDGKFSYHRICEG